MLDEGHHNRGLPLARVARLVSGNVAGRFGLAGKGRLEVGADADVALVDLDVSFVLGAENLLYRHKISPFVGRTFRGRVVRTLVRGMTVFREGEVVSEPVGRLLRPGGRAAAAPGARRAELPQTVGTRGVSVEQSGQPNWPGKERGA
jgi:allantoinase